MNKWFLSDYKKTRATWLRNFGVAALIEDALRLGIDLKQFPAYSQERKGAVAKAESIPRCTRCTMMMVEKSGPYGAFWACPKSTKDKPHPTQSMRRK